jgi:hypothetical protein
MSQGKVPSPHFDDSRYERPNKGWLCGHTCEGCPCRIGPSPKGQCRATTECTPRLVLKPGETKGTWACTRQADWGGPCEPGPLPDGQCCRQIERCRPVRSLRKRRGLVVAAVLAVCLGILMIGLSWPLRASFISPRPLSEHHSGAAFARIGKNPADQGCAHCHGNANARFGELVFAAVAASRTSLRFSELPSGHPTDFSAMDRSCLACHAAKSFHHANVAANDSCSICHREHQGGGPMAAVTPANCVGCHGDAVQMAAAREKGRLLPAALLAPRLPPGVIVPPVPRPSTGYTEVITSFAVDHPEFRVLRDHIPDPNTLRFNHRLHLGGSDIPLVNGRPLDCAFCHAPDASGAFKKPVPFETACRVCHDLSFDEHNPGLVLPHGDPAIVRAFLRSLPVQYADYANRRLGLGGKDQIDAFVRSQVRSLRERARSGEDLEQVVFLSTMAKGPVPGIAGSGVVGRTRFSGCALCHQVSWRGGAAVPIVAAPRPPDRWLPGARFSHAFHESVACADCHAAAKSERTSDVLIPTQQSCVRCHSPNGGVADSCTTCHTFHNPPPASPAARTLATSQP